MGLDVLPCCRQTLLRPCPYRFERHFPRLQGCEHELAEIMCQCCLQLALPPLDRSTMQWLPSRCQEAYSDRWELWSRDSMLRTGKVQFVEDATTACSMRTRTLVLIHILLSPSLPD